MSNTSPSDSEGQSLEGTVVRPTDPEGLARGVDLAFDYRGDVSIELRSGEEVVGYVFSRDAKSANPFLALYPTKGKPDARIVRFEEISAIHFSGEDTASGKSWEAWMKKKKEEEQSQ